MKSTHWRRLPIILTAIVAAVALAGCSDDDDPVKPLPSPLTGTWINYHSEYDGTQDPVAPGTVLTMNDDGTGTYWTIDAATEVGHFSWVRNGDVLNVTEGEESFPVDITLSGDHLTTTTSDAGGSWTDYYCRFLGADVLRGTWQFVSAFDEYTNDFLNTNPFTLTFTADTWTFQEVGNPPETAPYSVNGVWLLLSSGDSSRFLFVVDGNTLYLMNYAVDPGNYEFFITYKFRKTG